MKLRDTILQWTGTALITFSALLVSFSVELALVWWAFLGFLLGHIIWTVMAIDMRNWPLLGLNATFIFIDLYAMIIRI